MGHKTRTEIVIHIYQLLQEARIVSNVYHEDTLPRKARWSDPLAVIRHTAGTEGDIQEGVVTILFYVPTILHTTGARMADLDSVSYIEQGIHRWTESLTASDYLLTVRETPSLHYDEELQMHFISLRLHYKHF